MNKSPGNSNDNAGEDTPCKQRFKGVETFLRKIAFNLGNSPSQTEVKIISCIPIDVTDLQNKIISLERQLYEATNTKSSPKNAPVHAAVVDTTLRNRNAGLACNCSEVRFLGLGETQKAGRIPSQPANTSSKTRNSAGSFLLPTSSTIGLQENQPFMLTENRDQKDWPDINTDGHRKSIFRRCRKKKTEKKKENPRTQLVYYANTETSPFNNYGMSTNISFMNYSKPNVDKALSKTYLANVIQRHFSPECVVEEYSDTSHFTSPVCRDFHNSSRCPYESDVCSCCHGQFQDVDKYTDKTQHFIIEPTTTHLHNQFNKDIYYDSTLYDIVPVKEKTNKVLKEEKPPAKESKRHPDIRCWPEMTRSKPRYQTAAIYHQTKPHTKYNNYKKRETHVQYAEDTIKIKTPKHYSENKIDKITGLTDTHTSNSCCIDCSEIYPKPLLATHKVEKPVTEPVRSIFRKNAGCLTIDVDTKNLTITRSIQIDINSTETKTEETLNQIKSILQSVLAEVKTNPHVNNLPEARSKRDAVIQKGASQSDMQTCSTLLNSFTYNNSYNANPSLPTCSRQIASHFCYANVPFQRPNYTQNFPLLIQTPGHQNCGCFYKNSSHRSTPPQKQAASTATNTEIDDQGKEYANNIQGKETEKLIKEIYKSIALTLESQKETSNSDYDELKSVTNNSTNASDPKELQRTIVAMAEAPKKDIQIEASMTPCSTTTVRSNNSNNFTGTNPGEKWKKNEHNLYYDSPSTDHETLDEPEPNTGRANVASTISEHYSEELSSNSDSDERMETLKHVKDKMEKKGLLKRMLGSVKIFNKKKQKKRKGTQKKHSLHEVEDEKSESDSDDYQTIYSEKINMPKQHLNKSRHYKPRSNVTQRPEHQRIRSNIRSPYMEQEYRRQWNEQLMFQEDRARRYSSERPYSLQQTPVYWQNVEARSAFVDHHVPHQATYNPNHAPPIRTVIHKVEKRTSPLNIANRKGSKSKISWLKKHQLGIAQCGGQWKKFILEN